MSRAGVNEPPRGTNQLIRPNTEQTLDTDLTQPPVPCFSAKQTPSCDLGVKTSRLCPNGERGRGGGGEGRGGEEEKEGEGACEREGEEKQGAKEKDKRVREGRGMEAMGRMNDKRR